MKAIKNILFPVDLSETSAKIVPYLVTFTKKLGAKLHLLHVVMELRDFRGFYIPHTSLADFETEIAKGAERKMEDFVADNLEGVEQPQVKVVIGDVAEEIEKYVKAEGIDLIIMGTQGRSGLDRAIFGSVAEKVVKAAFCPVMTVNPHHV